MRYRLIIFDFDGTLADSFPVFVENMARTVAHFGLRTVDAPALESLRGRSAREIMNYLGLPAWKVPLVARYMRRLLAAEVSRTHPFPGVAEMLRQLKERGCVLAIVSSNSEATIRAVLGPENAAQISVFACGSSLFGKASKFRRVLKHSRVPASGALAIGDEIRDLEAAREAHIDFGAVAWGYTKVEALQSHAPDFVFNQFDDIPKIVGFRPQS